MMLVLKTIFSLAFLLNLSVCFLNTQKPKLTFDEFFNYTTFPYLSFSPNGKYLLYQTRQPSWNSSSYENSLWLYDIQTQETSRITKELNPAVTPQWSFSGNSIVFIMNRKSKTQVLNNTHSHNRIPSNESNSMEQYLCLYPIDSDQYWVWAIGTKLVTALVWSHNESSIYLIKNFIISQPIDLYGAETKDNIKFQQTKISELSAIYRIDLEKTTATTKTLKTSYLTSVPFLISEVLLVPFEEKLIFSSTSQSMVNYNAFEIYSLDLLNGSTLIQLTNNTIIEKQLKLSNDNKTVLFSALAGPSVTIDERTQKLYALNLTNGNVTRIGKDFNGTIVEYTPRPDGGVYILGHSETQVYIYSQQSTNDDWVFHSGWAGTYESIASTSNPNCSIAVVHSASQWPMEINCINIKNTSLEAKQITHKNHLFTQRNLPQTKPFYWINEIDNMLIGGILHYPPGKFDSKNLPLLVLIHGGPNSASLDRMNAGYYDWALLAASEGWLVLEPNYRGSTGYGKQFSNDLRNKPLSLAGKDILSGIDRLVREGIADPYRLTIGGTSYGASLTNWLITQTKRFNAAITYAGTVDSVSDWGTMDDPSFYVKWYGGSPWRASRIYQDESPLYQLDRVRTPVLISSGEKDLRVPTDQSYMLERALRKRGIPVKLLIFPNEGHSLNENPWHGKIKVREELKWLNKYGHGKPIDDKN